MALEKTLAIFGYPLSHTMSPVMHNTAAEALGLPYRFMAYEVRPENFAEAVHGARAMGFGGLCVTIPHKVAAAGMMDDLSEDARLMGAVNVIVFGAAGRMTGHNTDGIGWLASLESETGETPAGKRCLLIGAGGAARAIAVKMAQCGAAHIEIRNRTAEKAEALAAYVSKNLPGAQLSGGGLSDLHAAAEGCDLIVNTTSQGMAGEPEREAAMPVPEDAIPAGCICTDAVYNPVETAFLQAAKRRGARTVSGVGWLIHQGAAAWKLWTGTEMPVEKVTQNILKTLSAK
ncbi:MAG: shikimate dehydrogenase [bacterium]|nr:shikimate dehydrogenase [bacterium]